MSDNGWSGPSRRLLGGSQVIPVFFTLALHGDPRGVMVSYGANPGSAGAPSSQSPQRFQTGARPFGRIRVTVLENTFPVPFTLTLIRNATQATQLAVTVPPTAAAGFKDSVFLATPVTFDEGDDFDVQMAVGPCDGAAKVSVTIE